MTMDVGKDDEVGEWKNGDNFFMFSIGQFEYLVKLYLTMRAGGARSVFSTTTLISVVGLLPALLSGRHIKPESQQLVQYLSINFNAVSLDPMDGYCFEYLGGTNLIHWLATCPLEW